MKKKISYTKKKKMVKQMKKNPTPAEFRFGEILKSSKIGGWKTQVILRGYIADFYFRRRKLVIEIDGGIHNLSAGADAHRTSVLNTYGYRVVRFTNEEVLEGPEMVISHLRGIFKLPRLIPDKPPVPLTWANIQREIKRQCKVSVRRKPKPVATLKTRPDLLEKPIYVPPATSFRFGANL